MQDSQSGGSYTLSTERAEEIALQRNGLTTEIVLEFARKGGGPESDHQRWLDDAPDTEIASWVFAQATAAGRPLVSA